MLKLPRFTFLCGPRDHGQTELAKAIAEQDSELNWLDFEEPLRNATQELLFDGFDVNRDMTSTKARAIPVTDRLTLDQFYDKLEVNLNESGASLGALSYASWKENGLGDVFDRFLYRDCRNESDIKYFVKAYPDDCLAIHIAQSKGFDVAKQIWLANPGLPERIAQLKRELGEW